jgi:hypothetical protein
MCGPSIINLIHSDHQQVFSYNQTRGEVYLGDKHTSLQHHFIIVIGKKFYNADLVVSSNYMGQPGGQCYETFYGCMLQIFIISYSICP